MTALQTPLVVDAAERIYSPVVSQVPQQHVFYAALVDPTDTAWDVAFVRNDLDMFSVDLQHDEGSKPTLDLVVLNPHVGLLTAGRKRHLWLSWYNKSLAAIEPLFFGRIVGLPTSLIGQKVGIKFISDPEDYLAQKQAVAELKKVRPYYDPLFLDIAHRDDPDSIIEARSELWHVDRTSGVVTTSDIIFGEDGTEVFEQEDIFYDSVQMNISAAPLLVVQVDAQVQWSQKATGTIDLGTRRFSTYGGDGILADWPQPQADLGPGWKAETSSIVDVLGVAGAGTQTITMSWTNKAKTHEDGDTMSVNISQTIPQAKGVEVQTSFSSQSGVADPFGTDEDGNPAPLNIPQHTEITTAVCPLWKIVGTLTARYSADRSRTEHLRFTLRADLQEITTAIDAATNAELISIQGANVDAPLLDVKNWASVAGTVVEEGDVIKVPVSISPLILVENYQIVHTGGTAGVVEPTFSIDVGVETVDSGGVVWVGLGTKPPENTPDWIASASTPEGTVIRPLAQSWVPYAQIVALFPVPLTGVTIAAGKIVRRNNGASYQLCTIGGSTGVVEPAFSNTRGVVTIDGTVHWVCLGTSINDGTTFWISESTTGSVTGTLLPQFVGAFGTIVVDGGVTWKSLGVAGNFIGIPIGDVSRKTYFPSERGLWSVEYCLALARAHLLQKSRAVKVNWDTTAERITGLSCRKNARGFDPRLPGGWAFGKITSYGLTADGNTGKVKCHVQIECAIGKASVVTADDGEGDYCDDDYADVDWQVHVGGVVVASGTSDVSYTVPVDASNDDGLVFPLTLAQAVLTDTVHVGTPDIQKALHLDNDPPGSNLFGGSGSGAFGDTGAGLGMITGPQTFNITVSPLKPKETGNLAKAIQGSPTYWELTLAPLTGQNFEDEFIIAVSDLSVPKMIDLEAASS